MNYQPTFFDVAADLKRCIYASLSEGGFEDQNAKEFLNHALMIFKTLEATTNKQVLKIIKRSLHKAQDFKLDPQKRRENLLMAAVFLSF